MRIFEHSQPVHSQQTSTVKLPGFFQKFQNKVRALRVNSLYFLITVK